MEIKKGQKLYYVGLGYGMETHCFDIVIIDGVRHVYSNDGCKRKESDVLGNLCDLYVSKEAANEKLSDSWMSRMIP